MKKNRRKRKEKELEKELLRLQQIVNSFSRRKKKYRIEKASHGNTLVFAVIGDTHIGSLYERTDALQEFYKLLASEKINVVLHCGDLTDGNKVYRGQEFEQYAIGFGQQKEAVLERFPKISGIETFIIGGNHDMSYFKRNGILAVQEICKERDDLHYLDDEIATIILETKNGKKVRYLMMHPSGATAYAVCFDDKTEILTENGWKLFKDLELHEKVATLNPKTMELEFQLPEQWIDEPYDGVMLHFNNRNIDCMVTPNHRMFVRKVWGFKWKLVQAKDIKPRKYKFLRTIPNWKGKKAKYIELPFPKVKNEENFKTLSE